MRATLLLALVACGEETDPEKPPPGTTPPTDPTTGETTPPPDEICNGQDDDGDGLVDEDISCPDPTCWIDLPAGQAVDVDPICTSAFPSAGAGPSFSPSVGHLDDDNGDGVVGSGDIPEVMMGSFYSPFTVVQGDGTEKFAMPLGLPGQVLIVDADGDGINEIYAVSNPSLADSGREVSAWSNDGVLLWTSERLFGPDSSFFEGAGVPTAGDLDGDGIAELVFGEWVLDAVDGHTVRQLRFTSNPYSAPLVADLDLDGKAEIVLFGSVFGESDIPLWTGDFDFDFPNAVFPAAIELDGDPELELVFVHAGTVQAFHHDGAPLWATAIPGGDGEAIPCIADFDGDGALEIGAPVGSGVAVVELDGTVSWRAQMDNTSACAAADLDGDGAAELLIVDYQGLWSFDGATGAVLWGDPSVKLDSSLGGPVIVDFDGDGRADVLVPASDSYGGFNGLRVYDSPRWPGVGPQWSMSDFSDVRLSESGAVTTGPVGLLNARVATEPARVGPSPVLRVDLYDTCAVSCDPDGVVRVSVVVRNVGEVEAPAGIPLQVIDRAPDGYEIVVAEVVLPAVPSGTVLDALEIEALPVPGPGVLLARLSSEDQCLTSGLLEEPCP